MASLLSADGDGQVRCSLWNETSPYHQKLAAELFRACDTDASGAISAYEFCTLLDEYHPEISSIESELLFFLLTKEKDVEFNSFCAWLAMMFLHPEDFETQL